MKVLVTGAGAVLGQGIIRSLTNSSLAAQVVAVDPSPLAAGLYWVPNHALIPLAKDSSYCDAIETLVECHRPDALLVGTDVELLALAEHRADSERRFTTHVVVSSPEVVRIADDKYLTFEFLEKHGLPAPRSAVDERGVRELVDAVGFPLVVKPRVGARSVGMSVVKNRGELDYALAAARGLVVQECVATDADEYTAGAICFDGECHASIVMRRDLRDGNTYRAYVDEYPHLNAFVRRVAVALNPYGPCNFQFRLDGDTPKIFEINARFSGTTPFRMRAGFNEVEMVLRHLVRGEAISQPPVQRMTILRHFEETVVLPGAEVRS